MGRIRLKCLNFNRIKYVTAAELDVSAAAFCKTMNQNPLVILQDIKTFFVMIRAILTGHYKMPWGLFIWLVIFLFYFASPIDALPDVLPLLGFADDGAFLIFVLLLIHKELINFNQFQEKQKNIIEAEVVEDKKND